MQCSPAEKSIELDPLAVEPRVNFAMTSLIQGDHERALSSLSPDNDLIQYWPTTRFYQGVVLYHMGRYQEATDVLNGLSIPWAIGGPEAALALAHTATGDVVKRRHRFYRSSKTWKYIRSSPGWCTRAWVTSKRRSPISIPRVTGRQMRTGRFWPPGTCFPRFSSHCGQTRDMTACCAA